MSKPEANEFADVCARMEKGIRASASGPMTQIEVLAVIAFSLWQLVKDYELKEQQTKEPQ